LFFVFSGGQALSLTLYLPTSSQVLPKKLQQNKKRYENKPSKNLQDWVVGGSPVIHQLVEILFKFTPGCTPHFRVFLNVGCQPLFLVKLYYRVHLPKDQGEK